MADPTERYAGLKQKQVRDRAAAARELGATGTWEDMEPLIAIAKGDKSPSVRIYAIAAASDIACRHRGAAGQSTLDARQRAQIFEWLKGVDPVSNPGLLMLLASSADQKNLDRLGRTLRDPRNVVRAGAIAAVRRLALSSAALKEPQIAEAVAGWLDHPKLPAEVTLELARLVGEVGWTGFESRLRKAAGVGRPHVEAVERVFERLATRTRLASWQGVWGSEGRDVFEPSDGRLSAWFVISGDTAFTPGSSPAAFSLVDGGATIGEQLARLVHAPRGGAQGEAVAVQVAGRTWWRLEGKELVQALDDLLPGLAALGDAGRPVAELLEAVDGTLAARARAVVLHRIGALEEAREAIEALCSHKKPRNDLFFWLGRIAMDQGDSATAKNALGRFLEKAGKKAAYRGEAEQLLASL